ncbi:MAG TPA: nicotinate-nucleotide--dimethylbenzimidazole phosphoribosyltransferase [Kofleriaceae bacterium]|nr:nicotinate-nucleotide--dimethylbenzimidazole phosphoribosyltransferase [Kofleriaceae bacterium]
MLLDHVLSSILPASQAMAAAARDRLERRLPTGENLGKLSAVAARLAGARHTPRPTLARRTALVCAADHGVAWPGIDLGVDGPAASALRLIAAGEAAVSAAARTADAHLVLVDAGVRGGEGLDLGRGVMGFRLADGTDSITMGPAMSEETARHAVETGIALAMALADAGLDVLALGQVGPGGEVAAGALIAALTGASPAEIASDPADIQVIADALAANPAAVASTSASPGASPGASPDPSPGGSPALSADGAAAMRALAAFGGLEVAVQVGVILAAASVNVPVVLDDGGTWASALVAVRLAPAAAGYLIASHGGARPGYRRALRALELEPLFDLGLAHGEGTGALLALPLLDAAARVLVEVGPVTGR